MHDGGTDGEVLREVVFQSQAYHRLALHAVVVVRFDGAVHAGTCIKDALVEDAYDTGIVVDGIVRTFSERDTSGGNHYAASGNLCGAETDFVGTRCSVFASDDEFVVLGNLLGYGFCGVVEFGIAVAFGHIIASDLLTEIASERFYRGEEYDAFVGQYGVSVDKVEIAVGIRLVVVVKAVEVHQGQQALVLQSGFR